MSFGPTSAGPTGPVFLIIQIPDAARVGTFTVPLGSVDTLPALPDGTYQNLVALNRNRYSIPSPEVDSQIERTRRAPIATAPAESPFVAPSSPPSPPTTPLPQPEPPVEMAHAASRPNEPSATPPRPRQRPAPPVETPPLGQGGREHVYIQQLIKESAQERGWRAVIEQPVSDDTSQVDVALERNGVTIACEVSISTSVEHEMANAKKCLAADYAHVYLIATSERRLSGLRKAASERFPAYEFDRLGFFLPDEFVTHLASLDVGTVPAETVSRGYKVKVTQGPANFKQGKERREMVTGLIAQSLKRMKRGPKGTE